ncbi:MAG: aminoacyl-tRNA hydrolase [Phycisphaerae bacterium]|nr:aminoacyl-tRNA hydrolase [Phycisphaerae bacterium]
MKLVVGLGNPGREYAQTRHNIGAEVVSGLAKRWKLPAWRKKFSGLLAEGEFEGIRIGLLLPQTYMNCSGRSVLAAMQFFRCEAGDLLVVSDDLDLPVAKLRIRASGSAGGQKGLADVIRSLGTNEFARLRFGIGRPARGSATDFVLERFAPPEREQVDAAVPRAMEAVECFLRSGIDAAMNQYNRAD